MAYTLSEARERFGDYVEDPDNRRWTPTVRDRHLKYAHGRTLRWYARKGNADFLRSVQLTASNGSLDLSSYNVNQIYGVSYVNGTILQRVKHVPLHQKRIVQNVSGTFNVYMSAVPTFPATDGASLVDDSGTNDDLEELIILRAVEAALVIDGEIPPHLVQMMLRLERDVSENKGSNRSQPFPRSAEDSVFSWAHDVQNSAISLGYLS